MEGINLWAVLAASVASFAFASLWYSPIAFLPRWQAASGIEPAASPVVFAIAFGCTLLSAYVFASWVGPAPGVVAAIGKGVAVGLGIVAASFGINYQFAGRAPALWAIDGGFHVARFAVMGLVLGLWP